MPRASSGTRHFALRGESRVSLTLLRCFGTLKLIFPYFLRVFKDFRLITKYGYDVVIVVTLVVVIGVVLTWNFVDAKTLRYVLFALFGFVMVFTLNFFRDPERTTPEGKNLVISPADGKVIVIQDIREDEFIGGDATQISIFMSPLNVHVNRFPITGSVAYFKHIPGEYIAAFEEKASLRNERTHIGMENPQTKVFFKQIAGFVARRIVAPLNVGDQGKAGDRFGMIKFGSRVDVFVPKGAVVKVEMGQMTVAGETVLFELPEASQSKAIP